MNLKTFRTERATRLDKFLDRLVERIGETFPHMKEAEGATRQFINDVFDALENEAAVIEADEIALLLIVEDFANGLHFTIKRQDSQTLGEYTTEKNRIHNRLVYAVHFERVELGDDAQGYLLIE